MCRKVCTCIGEIVVLVWWMSIGSHAAIVGIQRSWVGSGIDRDVSSCFLVDLANTPGFVVESFVISSFPNMIELCFLVDLPDTLGFAVESFVISSFSNMPQSC